MSRVCTWIFLGALLSACSARPDKSGYEAAPGAPQKHSPQEERLLVNIVRGWNSSKVLDVRGNESALVDKPSDKRARTTIPGSGSEARDDSNCCIGARYNSNGSARPDSYYFRIPQDERVPSSQYPPVDRHSWQTQSRPSPSPGSTGRPGNGGNYGGNFVGSYGGNTLYGGSHSGDRFSTRPTPGADHYGRPGNYGSGGHGYGSGSSGSSGSYGSYGSFGRPTSQGGGGHYGISGTLADGEEFGPGDPGFTEVSSSPPHSGIQTQKAIALKALAGVALIGAAAALATNPVLLPIGIIAGRRKRSEFPVQNVDAQTEYILQLLKSHFPKVYINGTGGRIIMSPRCAARLTCEIQRNYLADLDKDVELLKSNDETARHHLTNLIRNNVLNTESLNNSVKTLIQAGMSVGSTGGDCNLFSCSFIKTG